jgi:uncharacterized protein DUF4389
MPYNPADLVDVDVTPVLTGRNRLTCAFRPILAIPHILLVGGPIAFAGSWIVGSGDRTRAEWGAGTGVLGAVASVVAVIAWFAILFTGRYPRGLFDFVVGVGRWHLRVVGYAFVLATDAYPPFRLGP